MDEEKNNIYILVYQEMDRRSGIQALVTLV